MVLFWRKEHYSLFESVIVAKLNIGQSSPSLSALCNIFYRISPFFLVSWPHEFKRTARLATRSIYLTIEIARCNHTSYSNHFFTHFLSEELSSDFLPPNVFQNLNATLTTIFCLPEPYLIYCSFSLLNSFHFLSLTVDPSVLGVLSPCLAWNDKNKNSKWT